VRVGFYLHAGVRRETKEGMGICEEKQNRGQRRKVGREKRIGDRKKKVLIKKVNPFSRLR